MRVNVVRSLVKNQIIASKPLEQFVSKASKKGNKVVSTVLKILGILLISLSFIFLIGSSFFGYLYISNSLNILEKGIAYCTLVGTIFILFISTTYLEYTYFRGKDITLWRLLPISMSEFFLSRFMVSYYYSLLVNLIVTLPLVASIIFFNGVTPLIIISSIILLLFLPVLPLILSSLLVTIKVYLFKGKNIKIVDYIFSNGPFFIAILYLSRMSNQMTSLLSTDDVETQVLAYKSMIEKIGSLPYFSLAGKMFSSFSSFILFALITFLVALLSFYIISPLFHKCLNFVNEANNQNRRVKNKVSSSDILLNSSPKIVTLIKKEFFIITGEKGFMAESFSEAFIPLILILVWKFTGNLADINSLLGNLSSNKFFIPGVFLICQLFAAMVLISSTSVSREGKLFKINKLLPIKSSTIVFSKVIFHLLFVTVLQIVYLIAFIIFLKINFSHLVWMIPLFILNSVNISLSGLFLDFHNPMLEWDNATSAMKRNINGLLGMLGALIVIAPSILIIFFKYNLLILAFISSFILLFILFSLVNKAAYNLISAS